MKFLRKFKELLNPVQVFDLMNGGPLPGYVSEERGVAEFFTDKDC